MRVLVLFNAPLLAESHADRASEAGVMESVAAISQALSRGGHEVARLGLKRSIEPLLELLRDSRRPQVIVNLCEGFAGQSAAEAYLAGLLELVGIPYTGSPPEALALVRQKALTKWVLAGAGIATAHFRLIARGEPIASEQFLPDLARGPLFVKPAGEDASLGITGDSVVSEPSRLAAKIEQLQSRYGDVLVERYIDGREFNVAVIALPELEVLPLAEVDFGRDANCPWPIVTYDAKWTPNSTGWQATPVTCPADVAPKLAAEIRRLALAAFRVTGCRDYARIDLRATPSGEVYVLEVNANPDIGPSAGFARELAAAGIEYDEFVERLVTIAARRAPGR